MSMLRNGRFDRGAVMSRAREIFTEIGNWQAALSQAYREADTQRAAVPSVVIVQEAAHG